MEENPVEQIANVRMVRIIADQLDTSSLEIMNGIEEAYQALHAHSKRLGKVLIGVSQSITHDNGIYAITLVGSVVDARLVEQQKRLQQFGMGHANPRPRGVN